jgi:hypothetical protein
LEELIKSILSGMLDFIEDDGDADYGEKDIAECKGYLYEFLKQMSLNNLQEDVALSEVKNLVISLNKLNERCDECLIETDQREEICELIFMALTNASIPFEGDPTEEWREW